MSFSNGPPKDKQETTMLLHSPVERGVTFFDTAEVYGRFANEKLLGEALAQFRKQIVIASSRWTRSRAPSSIQFGISKNGNTCVAT
jgi:aryl-alcohol dehydrogenase-like predicted oxidoreductase